MLEYELTRPEDWYGTNAKVKVYVTSQDFEAITKVADQMGGQWDVTMSVPESYNSILHGQEDLYVCTVAGSWYWRDGRGRLHQISSAGFCWDCIHGRDGHTRRGLVRHPITPDEVLAQKASYVCAVPECGAIVNNPKSEAAQHKDVPHVIMWGEETHPPCPECGKSYQIATPAGVGYEDHAEGCPNAN